MVFLAVRKRLLMWKRLRWIPEPPKLNKNRDGARASKVSESDTPSRKVPTKLKPSEICAVRRGPHRSSIIPLTKKPAHSPNCPIVKHRLNRSFWASQPLLPDEQSSANVLSSLSITTSDGHPKMTPVEKKDILSPMHSKAMEPCLLAGGQAGAASVQWEGCSGSLDSSEPTFGGIADAMRTGSRTMRSCWLGVATLLGTRAQVLACDEEVDLLDLRIYNGQRINGKRVGLLWMAGS